MTATRYSPAEKIVLAGEAVMALALARLMLHRTNPQDVLRLNVAAGQASRPLPDDAVRHGCARVAWAIARLAPRVPWRADCLVQALAGQRMLVRRRIASEIVVGTAKQAGGPFEAHAWLTRGERIILGGDIARFNRLLETPGSP